ncbi:hypothetical protein U1Q18_026475 [Sarracenia purpurea var. burkii]
MSQCIISGSADVVVATKVIHRDSPLVIQESGGFNSGDTCKEPKEYQPAQLVQQQKAQHMNFKESNDYKTTVDQVVATQIIELSDDDDDDNKEDKDLGEQDQILCEHLGRSLWHYMDPQGSVQGPFPIESLKRWSLSNYFPPDFKVWKKGQSQDKAILLSGLLFGMLPGSPPECSSTSKVQ